MPDEEQSEGRQSMERYGLSFQEHILHCITHEESHPAPHLGMQIQGLPVRPVCRNEPYCPYRLARSGDAVVDGIGWGGSLRVEFHRD